MPDTNCARYQLCQISIVPDIDHNFFKKSFFSRNGLPVSERVAALTFTHEVVLKHILTSFGLCGLTSWPQVAHSFGAPHDTAVSCPAGPEGEHLMAEKGSLGLRPANMQLSKCSLDAMQRLLPTRHF